MSKTLVIIRHGKSTWEYPSIADLDRPLKESGINNTKIICEKLKNAKITPNLIISSHAIRALHTALIVARELKYPPTKIVIDTLLYHDSEEEILDLLKLSDDDIHTLFIFGHNPTFTILSNNFLKNKIENLPTSGTVVLEFDCNHWSEISNRNKISESCFFPKNIDQD